MWSGTVTSATSACTVWPVARSSSAVASSSSALRAQMETFAPSAASSRAMARPRPYETSGDDGPAGREAEFHTLVLGPSLGRLGRGPIGGLDHLPQARSGGLEHVDL